MAENRAKMPAHRFAINLSPTSVCQARFPVEVFSAGIIGMILAILA
ncbi:hypothetical protein O5165_24525 [Escherichia coli]|nr:hypothetical protein [Escherichia coli]